MSRTNENKLKMKDIATIGIFPFCGDNGSRSFDGN